MTNTQKEMIRRLRYAGKDYKSIAAELGMTTNNIKVYCSRNDLTDKNIADALASENAGVCPYCKKPIVQRSKVKPRRFCSDNCRLSWWKENRDHLNKKALYTLVCDGCGKEFVSYGNKARKYCCHECYIKARFEHSASTDDQGAI